MDTTSRYIVTCDVTWYGIWYHGISRYIMQYHTGSPRNTRQIQIQRKPTTSLRSTLVIFGCLCPHLGLSSVRPSSSSFYCPSAGHIIWLTVPANSNLVSSGPGLLPERVMFVFVSFFIIFSLFISFPVYFPSWYPVPGTPCSRIVARYLIYYCCC